MFETLFLKKEQKYLDFLEPCKHTLHIGGPHLDVTLYRN